MTKRNEAIGQVTHGSAPEVTSYIMPANRRADTWSRPSRHRGRLPTQLFAETQRDIRTAEEPDQCANPHIDDGRVLWPVQAIAGESLLSWTVRTSAENLLPSCYTLLRRSGHEYREQPITAMMAYDRLPALSRILGCDYDELRGKMLLPSTTAGFLELNGVAVRVISLCTNVRRFSPASLGETGAHQNVWMVRTLPFCSGSWEYLQDRCSKCQTVQSWRFATVMSRCDKCGSDLTLQSADIVPEPMRPALSHLAALFSGRDEVIQSARAVLPDKLKRLDAAELFELTVSIASLVDAAIPGWLGARVDIEESKLVASGAAKAWDLLKGFPHSLVDALWDAKTSEDTGYSAKFTRRLAAVLRGDDRTNVLPGVRRALVELQQLISGEGQSAKNLLVKVAARRLGSTETKIAAARDNGILEGQLGMSNGKILFNLDKDEINLLATARLTRVGPTALGLRLKVPPYGIAQMIVDRVFNVEDHPWITSVYGGPQVTESAFDALIDGLLARCQPAGTLRDQVTLSDAMRGYGGGVKPWATVFQKLLDGSLRFEIIGVEINIHTIRISSIDARLCWDLPYAKPLDHYSQFDALCILNFALKKGHLITPFRLAGEGERWIVDSKRLVEVAGEFISNAEAAVRMGVRPESSNVVRKALRDCGIALPTTYGWVRAEVFEKAGALINRGPFLKFK